MTYPGVGPLTALAFVLIIGKAERFASRTISSLRILIPRMLSKTGWSNAGVH
jgi:hypothetical protein